MNYKSYSSKIDGNCANLSWADDGLGFNGGLTVLQDYLLNRRHGWFEDMWLVRSKYCMFCSRLKEDCICNDD